VNLGGIMITYYGNIKNEADIRQFNDQFNSKKEADEIKEVERLAIGLLLIETKLLLSSRG